MAKIVSNRELISAWILGDEPSAKTVFDRYVVRLRALARARMSRRLARRVDPDDVVMSAYRSFFVAARDGRTSVPEDDDLWPLLAIVTLRKVARQARRHAAGVRSTEREVPDAEDWLAEQVSREPDPEQATVVEEEVSRLLADLDDTARAVVERVLQGDAVPAIADDLGLHERTVRRAVERCREKLRRTLPVAPPRPSESGRPSRARALVAAEAPRWKLGEGTVRWEDYVLLRRIGSGAFSKVYLAREVATGESRAVKFLRKRWWTDGRSRGALVREFELLRRIDHPAVVRVLGWGVAGRDALILVTELVDGSPLSDAGAAARPWREAVEIVRQASGGVRAAHRSGVLHCDLKPSNLLRRRDGSIVLCDFGLSRPFEGDDMIPLGGTAGFLAPEQLSDAYGSPSVRTDVHGLGAVLYSLLTGAPPTTGDDVPEIVARVLSGRPPIAPSLLDPRIPRALDEVVLTALKSEPDERFRSVEEFEDALTRILLEPVP
jgi:RNA polymerase sigma factor (sigma-70 family)